MMLDGVPVDDRVVRQLATHVEKPLGRKLEQALFFSADVVALTSEERRSVMSAFDRLPWEYEETRERFFAGDRAGLG